MKKDKTEILVVDDTARLMDKPIVFLELESLIESSNDEKEDDYK